MVRTDTWSRSSCRRCRTSATMSGAVTPSGEMRFVLEVVRAFARECRRALRWASSSTRPTSSAAGSPKMNPAPWWRHWRVRAFDLIEVSGGSYEQPAMMGKAADSTPGARGLLLGVRPHGAQPCRRHPAGGHGRLPIPRRDGRGGAMPVSATSSVWAGPPPPRPTPPMWSWPGAPRHWPHITCAPECAAVLGRFVDIKSLDGDSRTLSARTTNCTAWARASNPTSIAGASPPLLAMLRRNGTVSRRAQAWSLT